MVSSTVPPARRAAVVVIGDLARSPRMCRQAASFAAEGWNVDVFACLDTPLTGELEESSALRIHALPASDGCGMSFTMALRQVFGLARGLRAAKPAVVMVQTPPAVHVLPLLLALCHRMHCRLAIDWHNFGWTILSLRIGRDTSLVRLSGWLERALAARAAVHLCVSQAMRARLLESPGVDAVVVRDRASGDFSRLVDAERDQLRTELADVLPLSAMERVALRDGSGRLLISATSWSRDEDLQMMLDALCLWSQRASGPPLPHLVVVVSGAGPLRMDFERRARSLALNGVSLHTVWLAAGAYPKLLAAADLGVCMHRSSSGVDLPMKIAEMLGVGLPVCAFDYGPCLREILVDGENGVLFRDASELMRAWYALFVQSPQRLAELRRRIVTAARPTWHEEWRRQVLPLLAPVDGGDGMTAPKGGDAAR